MSDAVTYVHPVQTHVASSPPFARLEIQARPEAISQEWEELGGAGSGYQAAGYVAAWARAFGVRLHLILARASSGQAVALLALHVRRLGPLRIACFAGEDWTNFQMGLFRSGVVWSDRDVRALLVAAGRELGADVFAFTRQPRRWEGVENPLAGLFAASHPSAAFVSALGRDRQAWLNAHFSNATQKKQRKKLRKLEAFGAVKSARARDSDEARRFLDAMFAHKAALANSRNRPDSVADPRAQTFLREAAANGALEVHALLAGDRIAAVFAGVVAGPRLSGVMVSYDCTPEIAAATPGEALLIAVADEARARKLEIFDLGVGLSRYKREICEIEERLFDTAFGVTALGRLAGRAWLLWRRILPEVRLLRALAINDDGRN